MFCEAIAICVPLEDSTAVGISIAGGAIRMSQSVTPATNGLNAPKNASVSAGVLNIFQFPAITRRRLESLICWKGPPRPEASAHREIPARRRRPAPFAKVWSPNPTIDPLPPILYHLPKYAQQHALL